MMIYIDPKSHLQRQVYSEKFSFSFLSSFPYRELFKNILAVYPSTM